MNLILKNSNNFLSFNSPYNISGSANNKDYLPFIIQDGWLTGLQANVIPIQVIENVDLVKDKSTLVRVNVANAKDDSVGNYSIEIKDGTNNILYTINFSVSNLNIFFNGSTIENNNTAFAFSVPLNFSTNAESIVVNYNGVTKDTRIVSTNSPVIDIDLPYENQTFTNEEILINWTASDLDGDNLSYAVLFSADNGSSYNTVVFDLNDTNNFLLNSNDLSDCSLCKVKVLVTDGVNTNESVSDIFEIDNDLQITDFNVVYQNNTERVFKIDLNNTLSSTINNIAWEFSSGEDAKNSVYNITLQPSENILYFIYHNYPMSGSYNASFKARSGDYIESKTIEVEI